MYRRKSLSAVAAASIAAAALAVVASPAHAAVDADDPTFTPVSADLIGVGSDTSQHALHLLGEGATVAGVAVPGFNASHPGSRLASYAATGGGDVTLPGGQVLSPRPNGSGAGKTRLYGTNNAPEVDFARSSSSLNANEIQAGLKQFPFALDTLVMAVSNNVPSNAPATLAPAQIVGIYNGSITNWSQIDSSKSGVIAPKIPQGGSGTRSFFESQLQSMNGGVKVTLAASVSEVQEHDDAMIKGDANAIAPFSLGRAHLLGSTLRLESGWKADRALYNVVRGADVGRTDLQAAFGEGGFACSTDARPLIEAAGFQQLATSAHGGVCGAPTSDPTSNFTLNEQVVTTTTVSGTSPAARVANVVAQVSGSTAPDGTVDISENGVVVAAGLPLVSGQASVRLTGLAPGVHTFDATFTPASGSQFEPSQATGSVRVKAAAKVTESFPLAVKKGARARGTVTVKAVGLAGATKGTVVIKRGTKVLVKKQLVNGKITVRLPKLPKGKNKLVAQYLGNASVAKGSLRFTVTQR